MAESSESIRTRELLQQATELVVLGGSAAYNPARRSDNEVLTRSRSSEILNAAISAVAFARGQRMDWMTPGSPTLVFLDNREVLAQVRCILPGYLRCELWEGDAPLHDESALLGLLRGLAADVAKERIDEGQPLSDVAQGIRQGFALGPMDTYRVLRQAGVPYMPSKEATDQTLNETEARSTSAARRAAFEATQDPDW